MTDRDTIVIRHAKEVLAELDESGIRAMSETDRAYLIGQLQHTVQALLEVVEDDDEISNDPASTTENR